MLFYSRHDRAIWRVGSIRASTAVRLRVILLTMATAAAAPGSALASGWSIQPTPVLNGPPQGVLYTVSCTATDCVAVGNYVNPASTQVPLVEQWNGSAWTMQTTPTLPGAGVLNGVSCTTTSCTAVGYEINGTGAQVTLAEQWTASTGWALEPATTPNGATKSVLSGVSCTAPSACIAVGYYVDASGTGQTLAEAWNGSSWSVQPTATPSGGGDLARVSCSAANACTALGQASGTTLMYRWDGKKWSSQTIAIPTGATSTGLYAITCTGSALCTAVGHWSERRCNNGQPTCNCLKYPYCTYKQGTLVEQWNGKVWTVQSAPSSGGSLYSVACTTSACTAVGSNGGSGTLAEQSNGSSWTVQTTPTPAGGGSFQSVSCKAASACTAVGQGNGAALAEDWNGTSWAIQTTAHPSGPATRSLSGVSCTTSTECTAVGGYVNDTGQPVTLGEHWDGTAWSIQSTPNPPGRMNSSLSSVSCTTLGPCAATGAYFDATVGGNPPPDIALGEVWNGSSWAIDPTPSPGAGYDSVLSGVDCSSATDCMAVGYEYYNQGPQDAVLAEQWNGTSWAIQSTPVPSGYVSTLSSVSCVTGTSCMAVGTLGLSDPLTEQWDGSSWTIQPTPGGGPLRGVSCPTATACIAVGGLGTPVADSWNGSTWTAQAIPLPAGNNGGELSSISCRSANDCVAVGFWTENTGPALTLAEHWDGTAWTIEPTPSPNDAVDSHLSGVSCTAATACTAVGYYQNQSNMNVALAEQYSG